MRIHLIALAPIAFVACSNAELDDGRFATGSRTIATSQSYSALYAVSADEGAVSRVPADLSSASDIAIDGEPTRIARAGERLFVTLRAKRQVAVLSDSGNGLVVENTIDVGAEPYGVVADEAGEKVYVANSLSNRVDEIDAVSLSVLRSFPAGDQPRWLALHPGGMLYAFGAFNGTITVIDVDSGDVEVQRLPTRSTVNRQNGNEAVDLVSRTTGDPAISPDGQYVVVPTLYVDNTNPVVEPDPSSGRSAVQDVPVDSGGGYGSSAPDGTPRFNPSAVVAQVSSGGNPDFNDAEVVPVGTSAAGSPVTGYPSSVAITPDSNTAVVSIEGGAGVVAFPLDPQESGSFLGNILSAPFGGQGQFAAREMHFVRSSAGPKGVVFTGDDKAFLHNFLDRTVERMDTSLLRPIAIEGDPQGFKAQDPSVFVNGPAPSQLSGVVITGRRLPADIEAGRRLYYSSNDTRMSASGSGLSCAACHFEGRNDGLTWTFDRGGRQTPSLAGKVSETAPVRWEGDRASVLDDAMATSQGLMGGNSLNEGDGVNLAAYVDWTREPDVELKGSNDESVARGRAIFQRPDVMCSNCHAGARYTDNQTYSLFGLDRVKTRSLTGLDASAPYFHDGSAGSIRDVLIRSRDGSMGNTGMLSDAQLDDLEHFLKSI